MRKLFLLLALIASSYLLSAQKTISGTVKDAKTKEPLAGASISIKGTNQGTISSNTGSFSISTQKGDLLIIRYIGYAATEIPVDNQATASTSNYRQAQATWKRSPLWAAADWAAPLQKQLCPSTLLISKALPGRRASSTSTICCNLPPPLSTPTNNPAPMAPIILIPPPSVAWVPIKRLY